MLSWQPIIAVTQMPPGTFVGVDPAAEVAALRADTSGAEPASSEAFDVVVLGGGLAGLCAAHRLAKRGVKRVVLLEAADAIGGNARSGGDCPLGAGYVPVPSRRSKLHEFAQLLKELGVTRRDVCRAPVERLYLRAEERWQRAMPANFDVAPFGTSADRAEQRRFRGKIEAFATRRGRDGRFAFVLPVAACSRDPTICELDKESAADWLAAHGFRTAALRWFVDYCLRDDYGTAARDCSAWVMLHYFCARGRETLYTWPDGLGHVAKALAARLAKAGVDVRTRAPALRCVARAGGVAVTYAAGGGGAPVLREVTACAAVCALPRYAAAALLDSPEAAAGGADALRRIRRRGPRRAACRARGALARGPRGGGRRRGRAVPPGRALRRPRGRRPRAPARHGQAGARVLGAGLRRDRGAAECARGRARLRAHGHVAPARRGGALLGRHGRGRRLPRPWRRGGRLPPQHAGARPRSNRRPGGTRSRDADALSFFILL